jgi:hypothetical protein
MKPPLVKAKRVAKKVVASKKSATPKAKSARKKK